MTDIPDHWIDLAVELTGNLPNWDAAKARWHKGYALGDAILAHAQTLMERDAERQEVSDAVKRWFIQIENGVPPAFQRFITPPQVDPDEELAREVAKEFADRPAAYSEYNVALAAIRAYKGRITDAQ